MVLASVRVCEDKKGEDIRILELDPVDSGLSDYFLIASGTNTRQTVAMADDIELRLKRDFGVYAHSVEGRRKGDWVVLDYTDFVVHLFTQEMREFYDIERLRKSARLVTAEELATIEPKKAAPAKKAIAAKKAVPAKKAVVAKRAAPAKKTAAKTVAAKKTAPAKKAAAKTAVKKVAAKKAAVKKVPASKTSAVKKKATPVKRTRASK